MSSAISPWAAPTEAPMNCAITANSAPTAKKKGYPAKGGNGAARGAGCGEFPFCVDDDPSVTMPLTLINRDKVWKDMHNCCLVHGNLVYYSKGNESEIFECKICRKKYIVRETVVFDSYG